MENLKMSELDFTNKFGIAVNDSKKFFYENEGAKLIKVEGYDEKYILVSDSVKHEIFRRIQKPIIRNGFVTNIEYSEKEKENIRVYSKNELEFLENKDEYISLGDAYLIKNIYYMGNEVKYPITNFLNLEFYEVDNDFVIDFNKIDVIRIDSGIRKVKEFDEEEEEYKFVWYDRDGNDIGILDEDDITFPYIKEWEWMIVANKRFIKCDDFTFPRNGNILNILPFDKISDLRDKSSVQNWINKK